MESDDMSSQELQDRIVEAIAQLAALGDQTQQPVADAIITMAYAYQAVKADKQ